ncbi:hypothetical protein [Sedimenticola sp.]|uniref:hypothetical protein n=1 Tax=Sedimenticola sp. TaxID=1940285 RepID=UPI003D12E60A
MDIKYSVTLHVSILLGKDQSQKPPQIERASQSRARLWGDEGALRAHKGQVQGNGEERPSSLFILYTGESGHGQKNAHATKSAGITGVVRMAIGPKWLV